MSRKLVIDFTAGFRFLLVISLSSMCICMYYGIYVGKNYDARASSNMNGDHSIHLFLSKGSYLSSMETSFAIYLNETYWGLTKSSEVTISGLEKDAVYSIEADVYINKQIIIRGLKTLAKTTDFRKLTFACLLDFKFTYRINVYYMVHYVNPHVCILVSISMLLYI